MTLTSWLLPGLCVALLTYLGVVLGLALAGRRLDARALAGLLVACLGLLRRLISDPRVPRRHKVVLSVAIGYLMLPFDLVPDFLPVVGYADDAVIVALAVRLALNGAGPGVVSELWTGSDRALRVLLRVSSVSLMPGRNLLASTAGLGLLGLSVCIWVDVADNCVGGFACRERDPLLLSTGRGIAIAMCVSGLLGLGARMLDARRRAGRPTSG